jgi:hypothetical protein
MGRQWNTIIESLGPLSGGTGLSINANLTELEALVTTLQADVADGISVTGVLSTVGTISQVNNVNSVGTMMVLTSGSVAVTNGTVTPRVSTTGGTGPTDFTSTSYGTIATASTGRLGCTIFNSGPGTLHVMLGTATASTSAFSVRLSSGDYYEVPFNYTGLIGGIFATAGTAEVTEVS